MLDKFNLSPEDWLIQEECFRYRQQGVYESLFTLGNGYLGLRGSLEENPSGSYRGLYLAGIFDKSESYVSELVKAPGWIDFSVWYNNHKFSVDNCKVLSHHRVLDMKKGILHRITRFKNPSGKILRFESLRVVFSHQVRGALLDVTVTPENFSGELKIISGLNGDVTNKGYFPEEHIKHLNLIAMEREQDHIYLEMETREKKIKIALAADTIMHDAPQGMVKVSRIFSEKLGHQIFFHAEKGKSYRFSKWLTIFTSREGYERQLKAAATDLLHDMVRDGVEYHMDKHLTQREKNWERSDIQIKGDRNAQLGIRFNIYHLMAAKPHHDPTVSLGAKFLTSEGYKGHAFWDTEIFMLPFYIYNYPEDAKNLLMFRYYTLKGALENARDLGYKGAKYAWESADTGHETTPSYGLRADGSRDKIFTGEEEHHIVSDVIFGLHKYLEATGDKDFLHRYGAEMVFQTARFWLSRIEKRRDRYEIRKVIGPDEFHEHVDNNAFTNYLAMWNISYAISIYENLKKENPAILGILNKKLRLKDAEIAKMKMISKTIYFPYDQKTELVEQFEGYFSLEDHLVTGHDKHGMPVYPRGVDSSNLHHTRLIKQADVVLLLYLFLDRFSPQVKKKNYEYYEARTMHKSSLSPCVYALMGLETGDHRQAYNYFMKTSYIDLHDLNRNAHEGIHAAATGGAWMTVVHGFAGMKVRRGVLSFDPWLPKKWQKLIFSCMWKGNLINILINHRSIDLCVESGKQKTLTVNVQGKPVVLKAGKSTRLRIKHGH